MNSKKTSVLQLFLGAFTLIALLVPVMGKAEQASAELRYSHVDKAILSDTQKSQILQGQPPITAEGNAVITLVYEADGSCAVVPQKPMLPHTGDSLSLLAILGVGLLVFAVFAWNHQTGQSWRHKKTSWLLVIIVFSAGASLPAMASGGFLQADTIRHSGENFSPENIPCYRYVGYIPPLPSTTQTTTSATTATTSATSTTETTTSTTTTTETTTSTTTTSTTTTTEATTVPSNPTPPVVTPPTPPVSGVDDEDSEA